LTLLALSDSNQGTPKNKPNYSCYRYKKFRDFCVKFGLKASKEALRIQFDSAQLWIKDIEDCNSEQDSFYILRVLEKALDQGLVSLTATRAETREILALIAEFCLKIIKYNGSLEPLASTVLGIVNYILEKNFTPKKVI